MITNLEESDRLSGLGIDVEIGDKSKAFLIDAGEQAKKVLIVAGVVLGGGILLSAYVNWPRGR